MHEARTGFRGGNLEMELKVTLPNELVAAVYRGAWDAAPWQELLSHLCRMMDADSACLLLDEGQRDRPSLLFAHGGVEPGLSRYKAEAWAEDPFVGLPTNRVMTYEEHQPDPDRQSREFAEQFLTRMGMSKLIGVDLKAERGVQGRLRILRRSNGEAFTRNDKLLVEQLLPHLSTAIDHFIRLTELEAERNLYGGVLERLKIAAFVVSQDGHLLETNGSAEKLIDGGQVIIGADRVLRLSDPRLSRELVRQVALNAHADWKVSQPPLRVFSLGIDADSELKVFVRPFPHSARVELPARPSAVVVVSQPFRALEVPKGALAELFGLTRAEAALAELLSNGVGLREASERLNVSINTVRTQLRALLAKTGARRQNELVSLLVRSVAPFG